MESVQLAVDQIKESQIVDDEVLLNQLESYIRDSEFLLLNKAIVDLYGEGKKEEAMRLSKEESTRILEFSLRAQSEMFLGVFSDFDKCRKDWAEKTEQQPPVAFGIDALDDKYGGIDVATLSYGWPDPGWESQQCYDGGVNIRAYRGRRSSYPM